MLKETGHSIAGATRLLAAVAVSVGMCVPIALAQDRDYGHDRDHHERMTRIEPGTTIPVRTNETIDVDRQDNRIYHGFVDHDVFGENGRLAIPHGAPVELKVRVAPDNDLILDLEAVNVDGVRYAIQANVNRIESQRDNSIVGAIVGAVTGAQVRGRAVRVPRDSQLTFRVDRPMVVNAVGDPGEHHDDHHDDDHRGDR